MKRKNNAYLYVRMHCVSQEQRMHLRDVSIFILLADSFSLFRRFTAMRNANEIGQRIWAGETQRERDSPSFRTMNDLLFYFHLIRLK